MQDKNKAKKQLRDGYPDTLYYSAELGKWFAIKKPKLENTKH